MTKYIQSNIFYILEFDWNDVKNLENYEKHQIWFEEAQTLWSDKWAVELFDEEHSSIEQERFIRLGYSNRSRILFVVFFEQSDERLIRIISARRATKKEVRDYEEGI